MFRFVSAKFRQKMRRNETKFLEHLSIYIYIYAYMSISMLHVFPERYTCMRFFILNWFGQKNPSELLNNHLKYFRFWLRICRDIRIFVHSAYYQNTEIFLPRIMRIRKFSFRVLSECGNFHSAYYQYTNSEI